MTPCRSYPAGVFHDFWLQLSSHLEHLPTPGLESHRAPGGGLVLSRPPHRDVQAVDDDVLLCLWAQQVQEVHLDTTDADYWLLKQAEQALVNKSGM